MPKIIASTYEIVKEIGSGGSGIVYLAKHLRLGKWVVLKADKRTLRTKQEALRREVDAMKNLSHTYIPQVYDFITEGETVYTVMDYVEGESLDKYLKRGQRFSQPQVIEWACQLLDALSYLHSRPPHGILHSDIKPSNIMLTPQNDIRLIDFNIALALGEEGAVRVGFSRGYASPEHYGVDYVGVNDTQSADDVETKLPTVNGETVISSQTDLSSGLSGYKKKSIQLDVRSDIYSLGATLYHLLSGTRPAQDARNVEPLTAPTVSPAVAAIIQKAMSPDPDQRYQSAAEMLAAFEKLYENDPRMRRHKRRCVATACVLAALFLAGGLSAFVGLKQMERIQEEARLAAEAEQRAEQAAREALAAVNESETAFQDGDIASAINSAMRALELEAPYDTQAQKALTDALGVYDLSDGYKSHLAIPLPSAPLKVSLSPNGTRVAVLVSGEVLVFDTERGAQLAELKAEASALADIVFVEDNVILYAGDGALRCYDLAEQRKRWSGGPATGIVLSGDGTVAAVVYKDDNIATVYDTATGEVLRAVTFQEDTQHVVENDIFADPENDLFTLNGDGSLLAVSFENGALRVFDLRDSENDLEIFSDSEFTRFEGGFYGQYLAFSATGEDRSVFAVIDTVAAVQTGGFSSTMPFHVQADESGIYVSTENILVKLDPVTGAQIEKAYTSADITHFATLGGNYTITATDDGAISFYDSTAALVERYEDGVRDDFVGLAGDFAFAARLDEPALRLLKLEDHLDAQIFSYDADYPHSEARVSSDGQTIMLFRYDRFRLYSADGTVLAEVDIPDAEQVYDQQYRRDEDGSRLEVVYNSGLIRTYSAETGALLTESAGEEPDETLYEEFYTDHIKITSPLHGAPVAYDRDTGELIRELEEDAYLTYVTQVDDYVITEYITAQGERYGLLLNEDCETLAYLPDLCDITEDGRLIFDDMAGNLRESRIYSIQELQALGLEQGGN